MRTNVGFWRVTPHLHLAKSYRLTEGRQGTYRSMQWETLKRRKDHTTRGDKREQKKEGGEAGGVGRRKRDSRRKRGRRRQER